MVFRFLYMDIILQRKYQLFDQLQSDRLNNLH